MQPFTFSSITQTEGTNVVKDFQTFMDGRRFSDNCYNAPMMSEGPYANEVQLGELELMKGQEFLYLFDYGDEWHFKVKLEKIDPHTIGPKQVQLIASKGEAPEQYPW